MHILPHTKICLYTSAAVIAVLTPAKTFFLCPTGVLASSDDCDEKHADIPEGAVIGRRTGLRDSSGPVCVNMGILLMRFRARRKHNLFFSGSYETIDGLGRSICVCVSGDFLIMTGIFMKSMNKF